MEETTLKNNFKKYVKIRSKIDSNNSFEIYKKWEDLINLLSKDEKETIELLKTSFNTHLVKFKIEQLTNF